MKIILISSASSIHTVRWANGLFNFGHDVHVISQHPKVEEFDEGVNVHILPYRGIWGYFSMVMSVRRIVKKIKPDIINAHYASGYATTARLVNYHPWIVSVWGSDVYIVPGKSLLHKWLVIENIRSADAVASTSRCMADHVRKMIPDIRNIFITPFGVEVSEYLECMFIRNNMREATPTKLTIGTVKSLASTYGIDILIRAFKILKINLLSDDPIIASSLFLRIVGDGPDKEKLVSLANELDIINSIEFVRAVPHSQVPRELARLDIYVALSRSESFGVAVIEAGAASLPVVVSNVGGLPEIVFDNKTGLIVPSEDPLAAAKALFRLVMSPELRFQIGFAGREHVELTYAWTNCIKNMVSVYEKVIAVNNID